MECPCELYIMVPNSTNLYRDQGISTYYPLRTIHSLIVLFGELRTALSIPGALGSKIAVPCGKCSQWHWVSPCSTNTHNSRVTTYPCSHFVLSSCGATQLFLFAACSLLADQWVWPFPVHTKHNHIISCSWNMCCGPPDITVNSVAWICFSPFWIVYQGCMVDSDYIWVLPRHTLDWVIPYKWRSSFSTQYACLSARSCMKCKCYQR